MTRPDRALPTLVPLAFGCAVLGALYVVPYLLSPVEADFARDLYFGYRIATGQEWIAIGPSISDAWHLGPAWYYLLALPLLAFKSITSAVSFVGVLAALQFPIAYRLGRELVDRRFGLAWAILLALPGLSTFESIWVAHPSLAPVASLAVIYALWRAIDGASYRWMYAACLGFGLALHAHPTTLPLAVLIALTFLRLGPSPRGRWVGRGLICAALIALPFAPLLAEASTQARDFVGLMRSVTAASSEIRVRDATTVAANILWHVPNLVVSTFLGEAGVATVVWKTFLGMLHAAVVLGLALALARPALGLRRLAAGALAYTLFSGFVVLAVRNETRFYMAYALLPAIAFVQAVALTAWARSAWPGMRPVVDGLLGATIVAFVVIAGARFAEAALGYVRLPALFGPQMDLRVVRQPGFAELDSLPLWDLDAIGRVLCEAGSVRAYGDLAVIVDSQFNLPARLKCGERTHVVLGGLPGPGETALFLLSAAELGDDRGTRRFGGLRLGTVGSILYPGQGTSLASGSSYPARKPCAGPSLHSIDFAGGAEGTIVIATSLPASCPIKVQRLTVDGVPVTPTRHLLSYVAHASQPALQSGWHLEIETGNAEAVQVFSPSPSDRR